MSLKTLPILFLNMGGEMVYILDQRLQAQSVKHNKASRVLGDIVGTMFSKKFLDELFKPQELYSRRAMRTLFDKLAHASIMRLNTTSMDKLYDLMTMAVKYQLQCCSSPRDILLMTMNHLDGIRKLVQGTATLQNQIDYAYDLLNQAYFTLSLWELSMVRTTLMGFYQDARIKVSLLLREKKQRDDGRFVIPIKGLKLPHGGHIPGSIRYYEKGNPSRTDTFNSGGSYTESLNEGSLSRTAKSGERACELGMNVYRSAGVDTQGGFGSSYGDSAPHAKNGGVQSELQLLSKLIGASGKDKHAPSPLPDFSLSLFESVDEEANFIEEAETAAQKEAHIIRIDASKRTKNAALDMVMGEMNMGETTSNRKSKGDELLDLMDRAE